MKPQEFWLSDPTVLLHKNHIGELWPKSGTTLETKLNAGSRLIIILSVLGYLVTMNTSFVVIGFITLAIVFHKELTIFDICLPLAWFAGFQLFWSYILKAKTT